MLLSGQVSFRGRKCSFSIELSWQRPPHFSTNRAEQIYNNYRFVYQARGTVPEMASNIRRKESSNDIRARFGAHRDTILSTDRMFRAGTLRISNALAWEMDDLTTSTYRPFTRTRFLCSPSGICTHSHTTRSVYIHVDGRRSLPIRHCQASRDFGRSRGRLLDGNFGCHRDTVFPGGSLSSTYWIRSLT